MKKSILLFIAILGCIPALCAQRTAGSREVETGIRERICVVTDKDNYLAGEIVWLKLVATDTQGVPLSFSKVGYVELAGEGESHVRARIEMRNGVGEGSMVLPSTLPTGWYRLVGYTRWMQNEGSGVFFEKLVGVVNPALAEVPRGSVSGPSDGSATTATPDAGNTGNTGNTETTMPSSSFAAAPTGNIQLRANQNVYNPRSEVGLTISGIPADIHTLSVSVTAADPLGGFTRPALGAWRQSLSAAAPEAQPAFSGEWEAEYEGALVTGELISTTTGKRFYNNELLPMLSFPGDDVNFFSGNLDTDGRVVFRTAGATGFDDAVTSLRGGGQEPLRINLDDPFSPEDLARPLPTFPLEAIDREATLRQSLAMQLQYSYTNDFLNRELESTPRFFERPDQTYNMEEWRRFATMHEVMTEFVQFVRFNRVDGKWFLSVFNYEFGPSRIYSLVLLDGIPIIDHDIIYNYNPLLIDRIEVYNDRYLFGNSLFFGIVALYTENNSYTELQPDPFTQILSYPSPQARRLFYAPSYTGAGRKDDGTAWANGGAKSKDRVPDYRHTLYWNADVTAANGRAKVGFFTSDLTGDYRVLVEGMTASGEIVSAVCPIEVR